MGEEDLIKLDRLHQVAGRGPVVSITVDAKRESYLTEENTLRSWLLTTDHKRIALLYFASITMFFFLGGGAAALMRLNLLTPRARSCRHETYNRLFTMHGVVMVWFFLVPAVPVTLGNFIVPLMLGARDLAFPRLNLISWYLFMIGRHLRHLRAVRAAGSTPGGRSTPRSRPTTPRATCIAVAIGIFISGFSSIATG